MRKFDTKIQYLQYRAMTEVSRAAWNNTLQEEILDIPRRIVPGNIPTMRCCVYKERAILAERVKLAMGGDKNNPNVIEVIKIACDECPASGYEVTDSCRGCLAHRCQEVCKKDAITFDSKQKAQINKTKCIDCGLCAKVCPYNAIQNHTRPCENACSTVKAISMDENMAADIDGDKCIACGACIYQCPFGAIMSKSYLLEAIDIIKSSQNNTKYRVYAIVAPAISSQFKYAKLGQVISGIKVLGFHTVVEAALGADMVSANEAKELIEKGILTSSCCPAFVDYVHKNFPKLVDYVSHSLSPMATIAKYIKENDPTAKNIFIGPCTAKKVEFQKPEVAPYIDCVLTFEELQALFDSKELDIVNMEEDLLDNASYFGRIFARSGGLSDAIVQGVKEIGNADFVAEPMPCDGIAECRRALLMLSRNALKGNFIEGMACEGGCISGAGILTRGDKNKADVDKHSKIAQEKTITESVSQLP